MINSEGGSTFHAAPGSTHPQQTDSGPKAVESVGCAVWVPRPVDGSHWMLFREGREEAAANAVRKFGGIFYDLKAVPR